MGKIDKKSKNIDRVTGTGQEVTGSKRWVRSHCLSLPMVGSGSTGDLPYFVPTRARELSVPSCIPSGTVRGQPHYLMGLYLKIILLDILFLIQLIKFFILCFLENVLKVLFCCSCIEVKVFRIVNKNIIIPLLKLLFPITEGFKLDSILDFETEKRLEKREESWLLWLVDVETH